MIAIEHLRFRYPRSQFELRIERLNVARGERVAFVGPSGSGKTTLLNLIAGASIPLEGQIGVNGRVISQYSDAARRNFRISHVGMVFQRFELISYLRARDNIRLPYLINGSLSWNNDSQSRLQGLANQTGIADKLPRFPNQLSQGEQQRVAICRALITQPSVLLADEPTGNLDEANKRLVMDLLFEQSAAVSGTLIVVTHDVGILDGFNRVIDFNDFRTNTGETTGDKPR
jgi:putative ABC transport system ATP-binding protein